MQREEHLSWMYYVSIDIFPCIVTLNLAKVRNSRDNVPHLKYILWAILQPIIGSDPYAFSDLCLIKTCILNLKWGPPILNLFPPHPNHTTNYICIFLQKPHLSKGSCLPLSKDYDERQKTWAWFSSERTTK